MQLVKKIYYQVAGVNFNKTFAPMAKFIIIRCILAIGTAIYWKIHQMDVNATFFNRVSEMKIYIDQLENSVQEGK